MVLGILIGVALTALTVVLALVMGKKSFTMLSYVVIAVALAAFSIEGITLVNSIKTRKNTVYYANIVVVGLESVLVISGEDVQNYRLSVTDATAAHALMRVTFKKVARYVDVKDLVGKNISEVTEIIRQAVIRNANNSIWMASIMMVAILVTALLLLIALSTNIGTSVGGRTASVSSTRSSSYSYSSEDF